MKARRIKTASSLIKNAIATVKLDRGSGIFHYGDDNKLPLAMIDAVENSGTARSCANMINKFVFADGLVDKTLANERANAKQTFDAFIASLTPNISYFKAVAYRVVSKRDGSPLKVYNTPINELRKSKSGKFVWNKYFGTDDYRKADDVWLDEYDPTENPKLRGYRMMQQANKYGVQHGDLVYVFETRPGPYGDVYPVPDYFSGIEDLESDAALQRLERRNITRGFRTPMVVSTGPIDNTIKDVNHETAKNRFDRTMKKFTGEDAASILHLEGATEELKPKVYTIDIAEILDQTDKSRDRVGRSVCRHFNVAPILVGFSTPGQLGNNEEIKNTIDLMQLTVIGYQSMIQRALQLVFPEKDWTLSTLDIFQFAPNEPSPA